MCGGRSAISILAQIFNTGHGMVPDIPLALLNVLNFLVWKMPDRYNPVCLI